MTAILKCVGLSPIAKGIINTGYFLSVFNGGIKQVLYHTLIFGMFSKPYPVWSHGKYHQTLPNKTKERPTKHKNERPLLMKEGLKAHYHRQQTLQFSKTYSTMRNQYSSC